MVGIMKIIATSFKWSHARTATLSAPYPAPATAYLHLCQGLLDTHRQVWVSHFCGHYSFLLGPGVHKVLFVPSKGLFPQSYVSSDGSIGGINLVGLMVTSSKRAYAIPRSTVPKAPALAAGYC